MVEELSGETWACEYCGAQHPVELSACHGDLIICPKCDADWREYFNNCDHAWQSMNGDWGPGKVCTKCSGFVYDEDMPLTKTDPGGDNKDV